MTNPDERPDEVRDADAPSAEREQDTEGHTMATYQLGQTMARERQRQAEQAARESGRFASGGPSKRRSLLDRLRGR